VVVLALLIGQAWVVVLALVAYPLSYPVVLALVAYRPSYPVALALEAFLEIAVGQPWEVSDLTSEIGCRPLVADQA